MTPAMVKDFARTDSLPLRRRLRYYLETAGFFVVIGFFRLFGLDRASAIGAWIGRTLIAPTRASKRARANLRLAFPGIKDAEIDSIVRGMWDNLGRVAAEYPYLGKMHSLGPDSRIVVTGQENAVAALARGKGILLFSGHLANWEILALPARDHGLEGAAVVRPANNPYVNRWLERARIAHGMSELISKGQQGTLRAFRILRNGGTLALLIDQRASEGILVPFFGHDAQTTPLPAILALRLGATLLPVSAERLRDSYFRIHLHPPMNPKITGDEDADVVALTTAMTAFVEARVREHPEQWLWIHRRWVEPDAPLRKRAQTRSRGRGGATSATSSRV
jgi:Kdo2-lipid IVA lauroyltransferase/acyltransferase